MVQDSTVSVEQVGRARAYIEAEAPRRDVPLWDVAEHVGTAPFALFCAFTAAYGITPRDHVKACRGQWVAA